MFSHKPNAWLTAFVAAIWSVSVGVTGAATTACGRKHEAPDAGVAPASAESLARALGLRIDAASLTVPTDPPAPAGNLKDDVERFATLDKCVAEHAALDPLLGDAVQAIGYETLVRDACRILDAAKNKRREGCAEIDASALRERCEATVAIVTGRPDDCPFVLPARPALGRAPSCLAAAMRDPRLCAAEEQRAARVACEALVTGDEKRCAADARESSSARCRREATRWRALVPRPEGAQPKIAIVGLLTLTARGEAPPLERSEIDVATDVARGALLLRHDGVSAHLDVGTLRALGPTMHAPPPASAVRVAASIALATGKTGDAARVERFELDVPGAGTLVCPGVRCALNATVTKLEKTRGGAVEIVLEGEVAAGARAYGVHVAITTFVRDVVGEAITPPVARRR